MPDLTDLLRNTDGPVRLKARWVLPISGPLFENGEVAFENGKLTYVGRARPDDGALDLGLAAILPGLVNVHAHLEYTVLRGLLEDMPFFPWIRGLTALKQFLTLDDWVTSGTLGAAEILGIDNRTGSIEAGKIANLAVVKGDLFGKDRIVTHVFVDGKYFEQKELKKDVKPAGTGGAVPTATGVSGSYAITIDLPGQALSSTLNLTQTGGVLSGTMVSPLGTMPISGGKVDGNSFSFSATVPFGGQNIDITLKGTVTGNSISGTLDSPQGSVPFAGAKTP